MTSSDTLFYRACLGGPIDRVPVWLMRQAGRYMKIYRDLKEKVGFLGICQNPEHAAKATLDAYNYLKTDAAIIFSDITLPGQAMGIPVEFAPGPVFERPVRDLDDVGKLKSVDAARDMSYVMDAIRLVRKSLPDSVSLIGFCGAPLTLASYMIEGKHDKTWSAFKSAVYGNHGFMDAFLERIVDVVADHALAQIEAGCDTIQLFDTQAGEVDTEARSRFAFASASKVFEKLAHKKAARIYFARNIGSQLGEASQLGAHVLGVDWGTSITQAREITQDKVTLMGNLDPAVLFTTPQVIGERAEEILRQAQGAPSFVFNLGHGVLPPTPPEHAKHLVDTVQAFGWS